MASDFTWPKPWLLSLYEQAIEEGCIRIRLRAGIGTEEANEEYKSFKAAFYRARRKKDSANLLQDSRYELVSLKHEPLIGKVLIIYSALPDDQPLPAIESVDGKRELPQPIGATQTAEEAPEDFDPTAHVAGLLKNLDLGEEDGEDGGREL